jgi:hypothetical protein
VLRDVPRLRAAKFPSRAGAGSRRAYSAGTPDLGEDDFEALLRGGPRQLVWRAFRIATVADSFSESRARRAGAPEGLRAAPVWHWPPKVAEPARAVALRA